MLYIKKMADKLDFYDKKILSLLQLDSSRSIADIAEQVGLSKSACHRRIGLLEDAGLIRHYAATIDQKKAGYDLTFIVDVALEAQSETAMERFEQRILSIPEVQVCQLMTGVCDYILQVIARDVEDFERIRFSLAKLPGVATVKSALVLRPVKMGNHVPL